MRVPLPLAAAVLIALDSADALAEREPRSESATSVVGALYVVSMTVPVTNPVVALYAMPVGTVYVGAR